MVSQAKIEQEIERLLNIPADQFSLNIEKGAMGGVVSEDITVDDWPFEQLPFMPVGFGANVDVGGEARSLWLQKTGENQFQISMLTPDQAEGMFQQHFVKSVIDPIVKENRNPITGELARGPTGEYAWLDQNGHIYEPPFPLR